MIYPMLEETSVVNPCVGLCYVYIAEVLNGCLRGLLSCRLPVQGHNNEIEKQERNSKTLPEKNGSKQLISTLNPTMSVTDTQFVKRLFSIRLTSRSDNAKINLTKES